jgi:O-antigen ligase
MQYVVRGGMRLELPKVHLWLAVLIVYATLSWLTAGLLIRYKFYTLVSSGIDLKALLLDNVIVFVLYLYGTRTLGDARFVLKCILLAIAIANGVAIGNAAGIFDFGVTRVGVGSEGNLAGRVFGAFGHANETAALTLCFLPAYVAVAFSSIGVGRLLWVLSGVISATLMIMSGSRGAFMGLTVAAIFGSLICRSLISWRRAVILAAILLLVAIAILAFVSIEFGDILTQRVTEMFRSPLTSSDERTYIWGPIVDKMLANPVTFITGFGWDTYEVMGFFYNVHNQYLGVLFELGIIGLASYLMVICQLVITARRSAEHATEETASYLIAFIYGIVGLSGAVFFSQIFKPWLYIWMYAGVTMRMAVIALHTESATVRARRLAAAVARRTEARVPATQRNR